MLHSGLAIQMYVIQGGSMLPTYSSYDLMLLYATNTDLERKDVVLYRDAERPNHPHIARIIGLPGEEVEIRNGNVFIDGVRLDESEYWGDEAVTHGDTRLVLAEDQFFVLGDNRGTAIDSRTQGEISRNNIIGRFFYRVYPQ